MKVLVEIPNDMASKLAHVQARRRLNRSEAIREAISRYVDDETSNSLEAAFGVWKDKLEDGLTYQEQIRAEWDDR